MRDVVLGPVNQILTNVLDDVTRPTDVNNSRCSLAAAVQRAYYVIHHPVCVYSKLPLIRETGETVRAHVRHTRGRPAKRVVGRIVDDKKTSDIACYSL